MQLFDLLAESMSEAMIPGNLHRTSTYTRGSSITVMGHGPIKDLMQPKEVNNLRTFKELWQCEQALDRDTMKLIGAIKSGKAVAVSDDSFRDQQGAAMWTIEGEDATTRLRGAGIMPGMPEDQSAYWSELFGLWGILESLHKLTQDYHVEGGSVVIACDGLSAFKKAKCLYPTEPSEAHYDLISAICNLKAQLPLTLSFKHVKGHQDQGIPTALLWLACLNIQMDTQAKIKLLPTRPQDPDCGIPFAGWDMLNQRTLYGQKHN